MKNRSYAKVKTDLVEASYDGDLAEVRCLKTGKVDWYRLNVEPVEYRNVEKWIDLAIQSVSSITIEVAEENIVIDDKGGLLEVREARKG